VEHSGKCRRDTVEEFEISEDSELLFFFTFLFQGCADLFF
jgi:hypothetical protein